jgi:hypothetical protein
MSGIKPAVTKDDDLDEILATVRAIAEDHLEHVTLEKQILLSLQENPFDAENIEFLFAKLNLPGVKVVIDRMNSDEMQKQVYGAVIRMMALDTLRQFTEPTVKTYLKIIKLATLDVDASREDKLKVIDDLHDLFYLYRLQSLDIRRCFITALVEVINWKPAAEDRKADDFNEEKIKTQLIFPVISNYYFKFRQLMRVFKRTTGISPDPKSQEYISELELMQKLVIVVQEHITPLQKRLAKIYEQKIDETLKKHYQVDKYNDKLIVTNINMLLAAFSEFQRKIVVYSESNFRTSAAKKTPVYQALQQLKSMSSEYLSELSAEYKRLYAVETHIDNYAEHRNLKLHFAKLCGYFDDLKEGRIPTDLQPKDVARPAATTTPKPKLPSAKGASAKAAPVKPQTPSAAAPAPTAAELAAAEHARQEAEKRLEAQARIAAEEAAKQQAEREAKARRDAELADKIAAQNRALAAAKRQDQGAPVGAALAQFDAPQVDFAQLFLPSDQTPITVLDRLKKLVEYDNEKASGRLIRFLQELYATPDNELDRKYSFNDLAKLAYALGGKVCGEGGHLAFKFDTTKPGDARRSTAVVGINTHTRPDAGGNLLGIYVRHFIYVLQREPGPSKPGLGITPAILEKFCADLASKSKSSAKAKP